MKQTNTFDPVWEEAIYGQGNHLNRYPYDFVVSFVYRHAPRTKPRQEVRILEIGCGAGNNLWFAAREGFQVAGIDGSRHAITYAKKRFAEDGLEGDLRVGDFTCLPFAENVFDLVIDRSALTCCGLSAAQQAVREIHRCLCAGGKFLFNPFGDWHSSCGSGRLAEDGLTQDIQGGALTGVGQICFYGRREIETLFAGGWEINSLQRLESVEERLPERSIHAEWRVIAEKTKR